MKGQKPGLSDISVEPIWPDIKLTCLVLMSVVVGQLVAIGYGSLSFCRLCRPLSGSDHPCLKVGPVLFGSMCKKGPGLGSGG